MHSCKKIDGLLLEIFKKWLNRNRKRYFYKVNIDPDEIFNRIILMDQHLTDSKDVFAKWRSILERSDSQLEFEMYMGKVLRNSVIQLFRMESSNITAISGEIAEIIINETSENSGTLSESYAINDLSEKISQSLQEDMAKNCGLRKILNLISLYYLEEMTLEDISRATGINKSKVYRDIQKALKYLRENIRQYISVHNEGDIGNFFNANEKKIFSRAVAHIIEVGIVEKRG